MGHRTTNIAQGLGLCLRNPSISAPPHNHFPRLHLSPIFFNDPNIITVCEPTHNQSDTFEHPNLRNYSIHSFLAINSSKIF